MFAVCGVRCDAVVCKQEEKRAQHSKYAYQSADQSIRSELSAVGESAAARLQQLKQRQQQLAASGVGAADQPPTA